MLEARNHGFPKVTSGDGFGTRGADGMTGEAEVSYVLRQGRQGVGRAAQQWQIRRIVGICWPWPRQSDDAEGYVPWVPCSETAACARIMALPHCRRSTEREHPSTSSLLAARHKAILLRLAQSGEMALSSRPSFLHVWAYVATSVHVLAASS